MRQTFFLFLPNSNFSKILLFVRCVSLCIGLQTMCSRVCYLSVPDDFQARSQGGCRARGGTDLERGYGDVRPWRPLFTPLLPLARVPFQAKESVHKTPFWENLEILASSASIFTKILAHKPPNLEIFSSQASKFGNLPLTSPPFQRQMSVRKPPTSEIRAAHPYLKKSWVPPLGCRGAKHPQIWQKVHF